MRGLRPIDLTYGAVFICLMAIGANITVWFPFLAIPIGGTSVPLSLQTFFAILAGLMLGKKLGAFAMIGYVFIGVCGVPVFAGFQGGPFAFVDPTGGFIISFVFTAFVTGWLAESSKKANTIIYSIAGFFGLMINYAVGITYMYIAMNTWLQLEISYGLAATGMIPFFIKDFGFTIAAALFMVTVLKRIPLRWQRAA
ncbi:biotin transporter BioY [Oceanobacillus bengalensis]|uniref:Biotin transporter n=1 Tax=Oceanobacillus bengalensis TaxID=1435466 RepID=A0A494YWA7_9BACI|nr:biotin transporter BioY [Oceanobacillus bengalensis]RKQ14491.1 biotin transporter BioY [Oceanobacillus bengalensis]